MDGGDGTVEVERILAHFLTLSPVSVVSSRRCKLKGLVKTFAGLSLILVMSADCGTTVAGSNNMVAIVKFSHAYYYTKPLVQVHLKH